MTTHPNQVPPPLQDVPTAKEKKYDRQLRLWGTAGQLALEETHILLINNGPGVTGVEALKNLVLPGIGQFTVLDSAIVSEADLGVNFFLRDDSLGKFRAEETVKLLQELNPDVKGTAITEPLETWIGKDHIFTPYTLVLLAAPLDSTIFHTIETHVRSLEIPTFYLHSVGYYSQFSLYLPPAFPIVDTHPDPTSTDDLRLLNPWPALTEFARQKTADMDKMNGEQFAHIPWVALLLHYLSEWQKSHHGKLPVDYKDKVEFRKIVRSGSPTEENFDEACAAVLKTLVPSKPSSKVVDILNAPEARDLTATSAPFWIIANAIQQFYAKHGELPLPGAVPDMKAQSNTFIDLQNIYKAKAREDSAEVVATVRDLEKRIGRSASSSIDEKEIENFCKGAAHIHLVRGRPLKVATPETVLSFGDRAKYLSSELTNPESLSLLYVAFLAWDEYVATHISSAKHAGGESVRVPGNGEDHEADADKLVGITHKIIDSIIREAGTFVEDPEYSKLKEKAGKYAMELARAGGAELHNIASLTGGLVAQEVIKVITKQYVPIDNTCVFDGIASKSYVLKI